MIQAIKDLANAFVPSGRLIELVDITLVRDSCLSLTCISQINSNGFTVTKGFTTSVNAIVFCSR